MRPIINLDQLVFSQDAPGLPGQTAPVASVIGGKKLGYNVTRCPPGMSVCPFHNHRVEEEMFFILEGEGTLRFGRDQYPLRKGDFVACPAGDRAVAHQIINRGKQDLVYIALSNQALEEICEYPDSNKIGVFSRSANGQPLSVLYDAAATLPYEHGEDAACLGYNNDVPKK
jgi:uncharacterized cupin superfamily protein